MSLIEMDLERELYDSRVESCDMEWIPSGLVLTVFYKVYIDLPRKHENVAAKSEVPKHSRAHR